MTELIDLHGGNVIDSSAWIEYFLDSPRADLFAAAIENAECLVVPTICLFEVCRVLDRHYGEATVAQCLNVMRLGELVPLTDQLAISAARIASKHKLAFGDAVIYASAQAKGAVLWTQDADYAQLAGVQYFVKP